MSHTHRHGHLLIVVIVSILVCVQSMCEPYLPSDGSLGVEGALASGDFSVQVLSVAQRDGYAVRDVLLEVQTRAYSYTYMLHIRVRVTSPIAIAMVRAERQ